MPEVVVARSTGQLYPPEERAAFVRAVLGLIDDPERRLALGSAGRERAQRLFTLDRMVRETERYYRASIARGERVSVAAGGKLSPRRTPSGASPPSAQPAAQD